jgi:phospholipid transport system substrate-binding protein
MTMTLPRCLKSALLSSALMLSTLPASAQPAPPGQPTAAATDARRWVETRHAAVSRLLRTNADAGTAAIATRDAQVARILNDMLDVEALGRAALNPYFGQQTPADQTEFVSLLRQLIERNYRNNLDSTLDWAVTYSPAEAGPDRTMVVRTTARSRTNVRATPVNIEYRLSPRGAGWVVHDLVTNGSSLVQSYREAYTRIIRDRGFPELLRRLRQRVANMGQAGAVQP